MTSKNSAMQTKEPLTMGLESVRVLSDAISSLRDLGDVDGLEQVLAKLAIATGVSTEVLSPTISLARHRAEQIAADFGQLLKKTAGAAACEFTLKLPFISLGCVRLHKKSECKWSLSVLDNEPIETIRALDARILVEKSIAQIETVEATLKNLVEFEATLKSAYVFAKGDNCDRVSANLLMVLCSHGSKLKKHASSSGQMDIKAGLTRAQFGYLLSALRHSMSGSSFQYHGATQSESQSDKYIAVPESPNPRVLCDCGRVTAITINN